MENLFEKVLFKRVTFLEIEIEKGTIVTWDNFQFFVEILNTQKIKV
jgi:hypothetical protein